LAYSNFIASNQKKDSIIYNDLILSRELDYDMFIFNKEDFEKNPFLERDLRNIFKIINKEKNKKSIYDLKYYYLFFYNLYLEKKLILPVFYLNDKDIEMDENLIKEEEEEEEGEDKKKEVKDPVLYFNSLYNRYNVEIFNDNNINLT